MNTLDFIKEGREYVKTPVIKAALNLLDKEDIESHIALAFKNGAEYALENQWINVKDDLPYNHKDLVIEDSISYTKKVLTTNITGKFFIDYMVKFHNGWEWDSDSNIFLPDELKTTLWMPIPKPNINDSKTL